ncbi:MAG: PHP domain-containing protein [Eubacteriales bacterium]
MNQVDLHVHSTTSDGTFTPTELVDYAIEKGLTAFALTDHDTIDGIPEAVKYANEKKKEGYTLEVIPGVELSSEYEKKDIHIVGLFVDLNRPAFTNKMQEFVDARIGRNKLMCEKLTAAGLPMTFDELTAHYPGAVITRAHYANFMLEKGYISSKKEAFERYIGDYCPCFVSREKVTPVDAIQLIISAHGIPILAHPTLYHLGSEQLEVLVKMLKENGLVGIEGLYSTYTSSEENQIKRLAKKYDLQISGGSDFHGATKDKLDLACGYGNLFVPEEILTNLKAVKKELYCD